MTKIDCLSTDGRAVSVAAQNAGVAGRAIGRNARRANDPPLAIAGFVNLANGARQGI